ncbi:hypothetical protein FKM82_003034 [Ascaphus truei]
MSRVSEHPRQCQYPLLLLPPFRVAIFKCPNAGIGAHGAPFRLVPWASARPASPFNPALVKLSYV